MKIIKPSFKYFLIAFFCFNSVIIAQEINPKEKITNHISEYFKLDRENIHLHLDKNIFFTDEAIWFKGYVLSRNTYVPSFLTTNLFVVLIDEEGNKISQNFLFASNGVFSGNIKLDNNLKSGNYYLQVFSNWMNNFKEDESSVFKIKIINAATPIPPIDKLNLSKLNVAFFPEGGSIIQGVSNIVGIAISDCNGNPVQLNDIAIQDTYGTAIKSVNTNKNGNGKFELTPSATRYKAVVTINNATTEFLLPEVSPLGIALEANNFIIPNKTIIKVKANQEFFQKIKSKPLFLVLQQNEKATVIDVNFNNQNPVQEILFSNDYLFDGVNTLRIIDSDLNLLAERLLFKNPNTVSSLMIYNGKKTATTTEFVANSSYHNANLSIAVLPANSLAYDNLSSYESLVLHPYLSHKISGTKPLISNPTRNSNYDLDLLFLNQKSKYSWEDITKGPPIKNYEFDLGINIKGTINEPVSNYKKYSAQLKSIFAEVLERSEINDKNEFYFNNVEVTDSSKVFINMAETATSVEKEIKFYATITNGKRSYNKSYVPEKIICQPVPDGNALPYETPSILSNVVYLDAVDIKKNENKLKRQNSSGNSFLRGVKIVGSEFNSMYVLDYIGNNGFNVVKNLDGVQITGRHKTSVRGNFTSPVVYLDDNRLMSFDHLVTMRMEELDEIYLSSTAIVASINNNAGIIKLYSKSPEYSKALTKTKPFIITGGYKRATQFINSDYLSKSGKGFENFGLVHWIPTVLTDDNGNFKFQLPNDGPKTIQLRIEGITNEGEIISEVKTVTLE